MYMYIYLCVSIDMQQLQKLQQTIGKTEIKQAWNKIKASSWTSEFKMKNLPSGILLSFINDDNIFGDVIGAGEAKNNKIKF